MKNYTLSWHVQIEVPVLQRRNWWDIFGSDTIIYEREWRFKSYTITNPELIKILLNENEYITNNELFKLLIENKSITNPQLEEGKSSSPYKVATSL